MIEDEEALEPDAVFLWVRKQMTDAGLDTWDAGRLALAKVDYREIVKALEAGATRDLILAIWL